MPLIKDFPCSLPTATIPQDVDAVALATSFLPNLQALDEDAFDKDAVWRDVFALTGTMRTFYSPSSIIKAWKQLSSKASSSSFTVNPKLVRVSRLPQGSAWVEAVYSFENLAVPASMCSAILALVPGDDGKWRIWVMRTILEGLKDQPNVDVLDVTDSTSMTNGHSEVTNFDCVVIGGGQAGLSMGGRLKAMGITSVVLEKYPEVGDSWKQRYGSARLHTTREYAHLPFERTFTEEYQEWLTKDDLARGHQHWVDKYDVKVWTNTKAKKGTWDANANRWTLIVGREAQDQSITCSFIVVAGGGGGQEPSMPSYPGRETFQGKILHSAQYQNADSWKGVHGIVVGTANTAHDVATDMLSANLASVTMIQRSKTYVIPQTHYKRTADLLYNTNIPTTVADRAFLTQPLAINDLVAKVVLHSMAQKEPERNEGLSKAGFKIDPFGSLAYNLYERNGGHYMDVGASEKISQGLIKIKSNALPICYTEEGLEFDDGTHLKADVIIFATGFKGNMRYLVQEIFGDEIAEQMGDYWGLDRYGEIKGAFKPTGHPAIWYHGGSIGQARYYSRFIAMQIKAKLLGTPLAVYNGRP